MLIIFLSVIFTFSMSEQVPVLNKVLSKAKEKQGLETRRFTVEANTLKTCKGRDSSKVSNALCTVANCCCNF